MVEGQRVDLGAVRPATQLLQQFSRGGVVDSDESPLLAGGRDPASGVVERDTGERGLVRRNQRCLALVVELYAHVPFAQPGRREHSVVGSRAQSEKACSGQERREKEG